MAEAKALFLAYDHDSTFESPEPRVLLVRSRADPLLISSRIAFARRVGRLLDDPAQAEAELRGKKIRFRNFDLRTHGELIPETYLRGLEAEVDLESPDYEITLVRGDGEYLALTSPGRMSQAWSSRRPRARPFFHPSAIFPKLARALVNLSRCKEGDVFLDPFAGTGSLPLEAAQVGARVVAIDQAENMVRGALTNMRHFRQQWLGVVRSDAFQCPLTKVDAIATDVPYGRASSTRGRGRRDVLQQSLSSLPSLLKKDSRLVIMHSQLTRVEGSSDLAIEEEHDLHVHKLLTRTITILRRR